MLDGAYWIGSLPLAIGHPPAGHAIKIFIIIQELSLLTASFKYEANSNASSCPYVNIMLDGKKNNNEGEQLMISLAYWNHQPLRRPSVQQYQLYTNLTLYVRRDHRWALPSGLMHLSGIDNLYGKNVPRASTRDFVNIPLHTYRAFARITMKKMKPLKEREISGTYSSVRGKKYLIWVSSFALLTTPAIFLQKK